MYLYKRTYVQQWDHHKEEDKYHVTVLRGTEPVAHIKSERITDITEQVGYWRKANAIHKWFVENVQDGKDDCGRYDVSPEHMKKLLFLVNQVLAEAKLEPGQVHCGTTYRNGGAEEIYEPGEVVTNPEVCAQLLPSSSGFFFGSTEYDQWYIEDLRKTKEILETCLDDRAGDSYYEYHSSW